MSQISEADCIFCMIVEEDDNTKILKKDAELICFRDICPAAPHHYLVVPRQHIVSCLSLHTMEDVKLVNRMAEMGRSVLQANGITDMNDIRLGFHKPPYTSVPHIHLHVLAPASKISEYMEHKFQPGTDRFVKEEYFCKTLEAKLANYLTSTNSYKHCKVG